jgi:hypothetical protein
MSVSPFARGVPPDQSREYRAIRTSRYTYARSLEGTWLLFDDSRDVFQTNNLVGRAAYVKLVKELDARLQAEVKRIGDDFRPGKDYLAKWGYQVAPHGSVPFAAERGVVQTPQRNAAAKPASSLTNSPTKP